MSRIAIYIVTFRRHEMLRRAIQSALGQSIHDIRVIVINDDPDDTEVARIVTSFDDLRVQVFGSQKKRGGAWNFNLMFEDEHAEYVALLEDDNWWERDFLKTALAALEAHAGVDAVCCNERIWKETADGEWVDTGSNVWPDFGIRHFLPDLAELCGSAKLCNSAMLYRLRPPATRFQTPNDLPVDVTEHFRERLLTNGVILISNPLVNYAETLNTARDKETLWGQYQVLLIGSVFAALGDELQRISLAKKLWSDCRDPLSPRAVSLVTTGLVVREAHALIHAAPFKARVRHLMMRVRRPKAFRLQKSARNRLSEHFEFLVRSPWLRVLAGS